MANPFYVDLLTWLLIGALAFIFLPTIHALGDWFFTKLLAKFWDWQWEYARKKLGLIKDERP